jgi:hypothetical protein
MMRVVPFVMDRKGLSEHGEAVENRLPTCIENGAQPVYVLKLLQQLWNAALAWPCASSERQAAMARTSRVEKPVAMRSRMRPARRRSASRS